MSDLAAAAAAIGGPEDLVMRSAQARATATGATVEEVLAAWAGGGSASSATTPASPPASGPAPEPEASPVATETATTVEPPPADDALAVSAAAAPVAARVIAAPPPPETVSIEESYEWDQVTTVRTAGLKERTKSVIPAWMVAVFTIIPLFAVGYITVNSGGPSCGEAGQLAVDFRNELVNCDLSAFEGIGGPGGGQANFIAIGSAAYSQCAACHGANGEGLSGPQLNSGEVLTTFSSCEDHVSWVSLGSANWLAQNGDTYGDNNKPVAGGMQEWGASLTDEEIRSVVLYERVVFGGQDLEAATTDCGLAAPADGDAPPPEEAAPADG